MTARDQEVHRVARVLLSHRGAGDVTLTASAIVEAKAVLDAVLPQVSTVEELEALPELAKVIGTDGSAWEYSSYASPHQWFGTNGDSWATSDLLINFGPLTVVYRPRPELEGER